MPPRCRVRRGISLLSLMYMLSFDRALQEVKSGKKEGDWVDYIFPRLKGLGHSVTHDRYAIRDIDEANKFMQTEPLRDHLIMICKALIELTTNDPTEVFGSPDDMYLQASMTLFSLTDGADPVFHEVLDKFFGGERDRATMRLILDS